MSNNLLNILKNCLSKKKAFRTIKELPISIWWQVCEGNFTKLIINGSYTETELYNLYLSLLQEYYDHFGTSEEHLAFINARHEYALKLADYITLQDGTSKMYLLMAKEDLNDVTPKKPNKQKEPQLCEFIVNLEKSLGFELNENKLSTYKFYSYLKNG